MPAATSLPVALEQVGDDADRLLGRHRALEGEADEIHAGEPESARTAPS